MKKISVFWMVVGAVLFSNVTLRAAVQWQSTYGGTNADFAAIVKPSTGGGYILGGYSYSEATSNIKTGQSYGAGDCWLLKVDSAGLRQWDKSFGGAGFESITALQSSTDGGYIFAGPSFSSASGNKSSAQYGAGDLWIVKVDASGNKQWEKSYGGAGYDLPSVIQSTADGGFLIGGTSTSTPSGNKTSGSFGAEDYWILKLDASGNKQWEKTFGGTGRDELRALQVTRDGGYILAGHSASPSSGNKSAAPFAAGTSDIWVVKIDASGNKQWDRSFGGDDVEEASAVVQTSDGGYLVGGHAASAASGNKASGSFGYFDYWLVKLDSAGNQLWEKAFGGSDADQLHTLELTSDGGCILAGRSLSGVSGNKALTAPEADQPDYWMLKLDGAGQRQWEQVIPATYADSTLSLHGTPEGGYVVAGLTGSQVGGTTDYGLTRLAGPVYLTSFALRANGIVQAQASAIAGTNYVLQGSTNLTSWTSLHTNKAQSGVVDLGHTNATAGPRRFYRVRQY